MKLQLLSFQLPSFQCCNGIKKSDQNFVNMKQNQTKIAVKSRKCFKCWRIPDSMTWPTSDIHCLNISWPTYYWNTVIPFEEKRKKKKKQISDQPFSKESIEVVCFALKWLSFFSFLCEFTCSNDTVSYYSILSFCDVNSIRVGTISRGDNPKIQSFDIGAFLKCQMHLLCIFEHQVSHNQVDTLVESYSLHKRKTNVDFRLDDFKTGSEDHKNSDEPSVLPCKAAEESKRNNHQPMVFIKEMRYSCLKLS